MHVFACLLYLYIELFDAFCVGLVFFLREIVIEFCGFHNFNVFDK